MAKGWTFQNEVRWASGGYVWDDWMFPPVIVNLPGIADPRFAKWLELAGGSNGIWGWHFDVGEFAPLVSQQLPHRAAASGAAMEPHVHWAWVTAPAVGETVIWTVEFTIASIDAAYGANTTALTGTYTATAADVVRRHVLVALTPTIAVPASPISAIAHVSIGRAGSHAHEVFLGGFDLHYQIDGLGSDAATSKSY